MWPELTHLQFYVLSILISGPRPGRYVRQQLHTQGQNKTLAAFYQLMNRLEEAKMVRGWYETKVIDGQTIKQRHYEILGHGARCCESTRDFYAQAATPRLQSEVG